MSKRRSCLTKSARQTPAGTAKCGPAVAKRSATQPGRVTLLERDAGYAPMQLAFNPADAADLVVVEDDGIAHRLRIAPSGTAQVQVIRSAVPISSAAFSPHGHRIAMGRANGTVIESSVEGKLAQAQMLHLTKAPIRALAFAPAGNALAIASLDGTLRLWRMAQ